MTAIASYFGVFLLVVSLVAIGYQPPVNQTDVRANATSTGESVAPVAAETAVDPVVATTIASSLAESTDMPISNDVANLSQSLAIDSILTQTSPNTLTKPQIVQPTVDTRTVQKYVAVAGDTVPAVAERYGISAQTLKWANNMTSDAIEAGRELTIPPVDGVIYTVRSGDTVDTIASRYKVAAQAIITYNDLELSGLPAVGASIILPSAELPAEEQPGYVAPRIATTTTAGTFTGSYGSYSGTWAPAHGWGRDIPNNGYPFGQCTFYAAVRRAELGNPVGRQWGNGGYWRVSGAAAGRPVDMNPQAGDVMDGNGHVAIVERVVPGVEIYISEMNGYRWGGGWGRVGYGVIPWDVAVSGMYRYVH